ncbi:hypothetical protein LPW11_16770 [Geomonas sp. RF6]|uniref:DUF6632 domain-containing protein n=1 Tax=Geomonas sp. RF6 TaxID=2897342 RepID=UPI001E3DA480|nr:DUF6632 domain-containing protein [Geomonas sp. RF6]UFS69540.1 hypothetical protein LPW11_16770 [Geomonas sp. RF6]
MEGSSDREVQRLKALRIALLILGGIFLLVGPLMLVWPFGWRWAPHQAFYEQMMVGIYFTLGIFLIRASRNPLEHLSLIWFTVWSSVVHGAIMAAQALSGPEHHAHLVADVPALLVVAAILGFLTPRDRGNV